MTIPDRQINKQSPKMYPVIDWLKTRRCTKREIREQNNMCSDFPKKKVEVINASALEIICNQTQIPPKERKRLKSTNLNASLGIVLNAIHPFDSSKNPLMTVRVVGVIASGRDTSTNAIMDRKNTTHAQTMVTLLMQFSMTWVSVLFSCILDVI